MCPLRLQPHTLYLLQIKLNWLCVLSMSVKYLCHCCCWDEGEVQGLPFSSLTVADLEGTSPLRPYCISLMHFHTFFPPKRAFCASSAFARNHWFLPYYIIWRASPLACWNLCWSCTHCGQPLRVQLVPALEDRFQFIRTLSEPFWMVSTLCA